MSKTEQQPTNANCDMAYVGKCVFINDKIEFEKLNFKRKEWLDRNHGSDKLYTLKFVQFEKQLFSDSAIEVCFGYKTDDGENYELIETTCEIYSDGRYIPIKTRELSKLGDLFEIITGKKLFA